MLIAETTFSMSSNIIGLLSPYDEIHRVLALCKVQTNWDVVSSISTYWSSSWVLEYLKWS